MDQILERFSSDRPLDSLRYGAFPAEDIGAFPTTDKWCGKSRALIIRITGFTCVAKRHRGEVTHKSWKVDSVVDTSFGTLLGFASLRHAGSDE